jgi:hypothetical protein
MRKGLFAGLNTDYAGVVVSFAGGKKRKRRGRRVGGEARVFMARRGLGGRRKVMRRQAGGRASEKKGREGKGRGI